MTTDRWRGLNDGLLVGDRLGVCREVNDLGIPGNRAFRPDEWPKPSPPNKSAASVLRRPSPKVQKNLGAKSSEYYLARQSGRLDGEASGLSSG